MSKTSFKYLFILFAMFSGIIVSDAQNQKIKEYSAKVAEVLSHDVNTYTQGLFFHKGSLFESSGQYGVSFFREVDLKSGTAVRSFNLPQKYFAEGAVVFNERIYLLTWMEREVLVYDVKTFRQVGKLFNAREGWGLTTDGKNLISTDGSSFLFFHDPNTFRELSKVEVTLKGKKVMELNELEYIEGSIWANIFGSDTIVIIDPKTGNVTATVDCENLLPLKLRTSKTDVLNGIAYNPVTKAIYLTGKYWPKMYRVELVEK
ncbi:MAG: glutaminyl-peptide cyclotransferase [Bacteroidales bacterium]